MNGRRRLDHLAAKELWAADGHASDLVVCALADGEASLVPGDVREHVLGCETCKQRLADAALASLTTSRTLATVAAAVPELLSRQPRGPIVPRYAVPLALLLGLVGSVPRLLELREVVGGAPSSLPGIVVLVVKATMVLFRSASRDETLRVGAVWGIAALVLLALGAFIVRLAPERAGFREEQ